MCLCVFAISPVARRAMLHRGIRETVSDNRRTAQHSHMPPKRTPFAQPRSRRPLRGCFRGPSIHACRSCAHQQPAHAFLGRHPQLLQAEGRVSAACGSSGLPRVHCRSSARNPGAAGCGNVQCNQQPRGISPARICGRPRMIITDKGY